MMMKKIDAHHPPPHSTSSACAKEDKEDVFPKAGIRLSYIVNEFLPKVCSSSSRLLLLDDDHDRTDEDQQQQQQREEHTTTLCLSLEGWTTSQVLWQN